VTSLLTLIGSAEFVWSMAGVAPLGTGECDAEAESGAVVRSL
jgi:hypothetical protein